jgi:hypothetical protein
MIKKTMYRLGEYRINEYENGLLWWEAHHGFGAQRSGKCFLADDILIVGNWSHEKNGYLKGEFLDQLRELPAWNKTKYYCFAVELSEVATGRGLQEKSLEQLVSLANIKKAGAEAPVEDNPGTFRLGKYQITVAADGQLSWQAHGGMKRVGGGRCNVQSGVLLIGRQEFEEAGPGKREFLDQLGRLPEWKGTGTWSHSAALRMCQPREQEEWPSTTRPLRDTESDRPSYEKHASYRYQHERPLTRVVPSGFKFGKPSEKPPSGRKLWLLWLIPLVLIGLVFGLISALHSLAKKLHWFRSHDEHYHRYKP